MGNVHALMTVAAVTFNSVSYSADDIVAAYDGAPQCGDGRTGRFARRARAATAWQYDAFGQTLRDVALECGDGAFTQRPRRENRTGAHLGGEMNQSGAYAASNPFRFSTKYTDIDEARMREDGPTEWLARRERRADAQWGSATKQTGLVYYGHRYYSPNLGRFINRDPIEEQGGINLYSFVGNNAVNSWDYLGMDSFGSYHLDSSSGNYYWVEEDGMTGQDFMPPFGGPVMNKARELSRPWKLGQNTWMRKIKRKPDKQ